MIYGINNDPNLSKFLLNRHLIKQYVSIVNKQEWEKGFRELIILIFDLYIMPNLCRICQTNAHGTYADFFSGKPWLNSQILSTTSHSWEKRLMDRQTDRQTNLPNTIVYFWHFCWMCTKTLNFKMPASNIPIANWALRYNRVN